MRKLSHRAMSRALRAAALLFVVIVVIVSARTVRGGEQDDIETQINPEHADVIDLEHLDEQHTALSDIKLLQAWLDEAWTLRLKHDYDHAREVLDRTLSQEQLIREEIVASKLAAEVKNHEGALQDLRLEIDRVRGALQKAKTDEKALGAPTN
jgi:hypothetical protein